MKKKYIVLLVGLILIVCIPFFPPIYDRYTRPLYKSYVDSKEWYGKGDCKNLEDSMPCCPPLGYVIELQPLGDFSHGKAEELRNEFVKQLALIFRTKSKGELDASVIVRESKEIPASYLYKPRNRYWAGAILKILHADHGGNDEIVTIGLTNRDISTSVHGQYNYGIMGLSYRPGDACVVSTYRLKQKDDLWKVVTHEFLHSRGLPHCRKDNPKCLMQDAHGKNTFYMKHGLCEDCKGKIAN